MVATAAVLAHTATAVSLQSAPYAPPAAARPASRKARVETRQLRRRFRLGLATGIFR
jgi:hypothetical protein